MDGSRDFERGFYKFELLYWDVVCLDGGGGGGVTIKETFKNSNQQFSIIIVIVLLSCTLQLRKVEISDQQSSAHNLTLLQVFRVRNIVL